MTAYGAKRFRSLQGAGHKGVVRYRHVDIKKVGNKKGKIFPVRLKFFCCLSMVDGCQNNLEFYGFVCYARALCFENIFSSTSLFQVSAMTPFMQGLYV